MTDRIGQQLGNYRITRPIGHGSFADVYLGEHIYLQTLVAIKLLRMQLAKEDMEGFLKEARTIAHLVHPRIVRVLDFGIEGGTPFLVMDYAPNGTLRQRHPKGTTLPLTTISSYVKQVADALQYAHDKKLIHRDVKPENILLGYYNEVLLSDFGIALVAQSSRYQGTQEVAGTVAYMSPEQIQGKPRPASDQYALGIVVYEWLSGYCPFHGSFTELCTQHLFAPPPFLSEKVPAISPEVEQVVLRALAKDPHWRFESVQAFAAALERACQLTASHQGPLPRQVPLPSGPSLFTPADATILPGQSSQPTNVVTPPHQLLEPAAAATAPHTPDISPRTTREAVPAAGIQPPKRVISRRTVLVGLAAGLAFTGGITYVLASHNWAPFSTQSPTPIFTYRGHFAPVTEVAWSPDGKYIASASVDGTVQIWDATTGSDALIYRGGSAPVTYYIDTSPTSNPVPVWSVAWSHNGKYIVSASQDPAVYVWEATYGGRTLVTYNGHSDGVDSVRWSPDDTRIASGSADRTVQVWDALHGGRALVTHSGYSAPVPGVAWSPDGTRIVAGSRDKTVRIWDATNGGSALLTYTGHSDAVNSVAWSPVGPRIASGSVDKTVQVWDATNGISLVTYRGHSDQVTGVVWSPDGKRISSSSWDYTVQVCDATSGALLVTYKGHSGHANTVAWSPDGTRIASGSGDKTVQVWEAM